MEIDYVRLFQGIFMILGTLSYSLIIPFILKGIDRENLNKIKDVADILVKSTEQLMFKSKGMEKKDFVLKRLQEAFPHTKYSNLEKIVESAVFEMNNVIGKINENSLN